MFSYTESTGMRLKDWKMKPRVSWRSVVSCLVAQVLGRPSVDEDRARGRPVDAAEHVEDGRLARARGPGDGDEVSLLDAEGDALHRLDFDLAEGIDLADVLELYDHHTYSLTRAPPGTALGASGGSGRRRGCPGGLSCFVT